MFFSSLPSHIAPIGGILHYELADLTTPSVDLRIYTSSNRLLGTKRIVGQSDCAIDIAPYLRSAVVPTLPETIEACGVVECPTQMKVVVQAGGVNSSTRTFIAAKVDLDNYYQPLTTQHLHRTMARDEFDLISFFSYADIVVEVVVEFFGKGNESLTITPDAGGQRVVAVTAKGRPGVSSMRVTVMADGEAVTTIEYDIKENLKGARRVAWLNDHLAPELYTFPLRKSVLIKAARKRMESIWGSEAGTAERENELKLISAYEPQAQIEALTSILSTPRAWLVEGSTLQNVEITTDRVMPSSCGEMGIIEVDIRAAREGEVLW